jgi:hypothetical protein
MRPSDFLLPFFAFVLIVLIGLSGAIHGWTTDRTFDGLLEKTYVDRGNTYFVVLEDGEETPVVYENEDAWFFLKWNSGDVLRDLDAGQRYTFHVYGWRVPFLSWFPNIVSVTPLGE